MIAHPVSVANANASLQLPMGSSKRAECQTTQDLILRWVYPFHEENRALLELVQTTGFTNAYGPKTTAYRAYPIRVVWKASILASCKVFTTGISFCFCPSHRTMMDYASIQNHCGYQYQGHQCTTGWALCERMREMMIVQYSQCLWFAGYMV